MDLSVFDSMDARELRNYLQFLLWHYRVMDAFWYIYVGEMFDEATARPAERKGVGQGVSHGSQRHPEKV